MSTQQNERFIKGCLKLESNLVELHAILERQQSLGQTKRADETKKMIALIERTLSGLDYK